VNTDLIGSIELTASAAIVIAALSIGFGSNPLMRARIAAWLSAWFVLVVVLAATHALYYEHGLGAPGLGIAVAFPIAILSPGEKGSPLHGRERSGEVDQLINYLYDDLRCHLWAACACARVSTYV